MQIAIKCRICKASGEVINFVNRELARGTSLQKISKLAYKKFTIYFPKSSIAIHKLHYTNPETRVRALYHSSMGYARTRY